jgi:hypothetical protein
MRAISCARCVGVGLDVSKLGFVCGMLLWVHDSSTTWEGPLKVKVQFPPRRSSLSLSYSLKCIAKMLSLY